MTVLTIGEEAGCYGSDPMDGLPSAYGIDGTAEYEGQHKRCYNVDYIGWISRPKDGVQGMLTEHSFGDWLRQRRRALDLTQDELAQRVGCSAITLRKLEAEERRPSKQIAERLADVLKVAPADRQAFLRFARGDPFAAPDASPTAPQAVQQSEQPKAPRNNLPIQLTPLIGRVLLVAAIVERLRPADSKPVRLLTLTGPGGTGKTRLALQVATELLGEFADGVFFVDLAPIPNPTLVALTIAETLGVSVLGAQLPLDRLKDHLRDKHLLLVLDNFEHLLEAAPQLTALLAAAPRLTLLVTSRVVLHLSGEQELPVPPLAVPDLQQLPSVEALAQVAAVALFIQRTQAAEPDFQMTQQTAPAVAEICVRLDGLPLAIELAAARSKVLEPGALLARLSLRLGLLIGGPRDLPTRQQTLRSTIDWSYRLLAEKEQVLFARLGVFVGGWTLDATAQVCNATADLPFDMLDGLQALLDHSLIQKEARSGGAKQFSMLETIGEYARERLEASGEAQAIRRQHATYFVELIEARVPTEWQRRKPAWLDHVETEQDNLRAAMTWAQSAVGGAELGLSLAVAMSDFAVGQGYKSEARDWLEAALAHAETEALQDKRLIAWALLNLTGLLGSLGDYAAAQGKATQSLRLFQELGDRQSSASAHMWLGWLAREQGDTATARLRLEESLALFRESGNEPRVAWTLNNLGEVAVVQEDVAWATSLLEESLALFRAQKTPDGIAWSLNHLGHVAQLQGHYARARQLHDESLPLFRESAAQNNGNQGIAHAFQSLGETALAQSDATSATTHLGRALVLLRDLGERSGISWCLAGLAGAAASHEEPERAARLWGFAEALRQAIGCRPAPATRATHERLMAAARQQLGDVAFEAQWAAGQAMTMDQAIELALQAKAEA